MGTQPTPEILAERSARVRAYAGELGFDLCGVAAAGSIDPENRLEAWLDAGCHAGMDWLERSKSVRQDIQAFLPGANSVVVTARNYRTDGIESGPGTGRISRYAWGRDYHRVLAKPLKALSAFLDTLVPGGQSRWCVDSGPVLERAWAARAGLGWTGRHSLLIHPVLGSWVFLSVVATTVELAPDAPIAGHCGSCRKCVEACPTGAIVTEGVVDARRCISYHTIENRGAIPGDVAAAMGDWVFGCDVCQDVCPWNRRTPETNEKDFAARPGVANPPLDELRAMDEPAFHARFEGTPVRRAKWEGMRRNADIAARNQADEA